MKKYVICICYDQFEYINYFDLVADDVVIEQNIAEEKVDKLFVRLIEEANLNMPFVLNIIQEEDATEWDYENKLRECGIVIQQLNDKDFDIITEVEDPNKKKVNILFSGICVVKGNVEKYGDGNSQAKETIRQAEEILKRGGEEMTELARIIREKYERMNRNE